MARKGAATQIYETLRNRIITCEYDKDVILNEVQLANEFGVSRTPIREALHRLEENQFISLSKAGAQLLPMDVLWLRDAYESKSVIFTGIAVLACDRITPRSSRKLADLIEQSTAEMDDQTFLKWYDSVNRLIVQITRNEMFQNILDGVYDNLSRFMAYCIINEFCDRAMIDQSLKDLAKAIIAKDKRLAMICVGNHIDKSMSIHPPSKVFDGVQDIWEDIAILGNKSKTLPKT